MKRSINRIGVGVAAGVLALGGIGLSAATAATEGAVALATEVASGMIQKVNLAANEFTVRVSSDGAAGEAKDVTFKINDSTNFTLDGKASNKSEALKAGRDASVSHEEKVAMRVDVQSKQPG